MTPFDHKFGETFWGFNEAPSEQGMQYLIDRAKDPEYWAKVDNMAMTVGSAVALFTPGQSILSLFRAKSGTAIPTITNTGETLGAFGIPKYYTYTKGAQSVFVSPHAMKHLEELAVNGAKLGPDYLKLIGQVHLKAINSAIDDVLSRGSIQFRKMYNSGGNEIMFGAPRSAGELPSVIHFR
jgi:hypothetical protein